MPVIILFVADSPIHSRGLFAKTCIPAGVSIGVIEGEPASEDGEHVLWLDEQHGFLVQCDFRYINHSTEPNAIYYDNLEVWSLRDIQPGEEITHDYDAGWR